MWSTDNSRTWDWKFYQKSPAFVDLWVIIRFSGGFQKKDILFSGLVILNYRGLFCHFMYWNSNDSQSNTILKYENLWEFGISIFVV